MGGGGQRLFILIGAGAGGGGGQVIWADRIAPSKNSNLHDPERLKIFVTTRGSRKNCYGGASPIMPPPPCRK